MRPIVVASRNAHKIREIGQILGTLDVELRPLPEGAPEVVEDGDTFAANATKKAESAAAATGQWALADDSGLEVDALGGAPGVLSARFAGVEGDGADAANNRLLLERLADVPDAERTGRFRCVIALARPGEATRTFDGAVEGRIARKESGAGGFGYDPLFFHPPFGCTFGAVPPEQKNSVSHRAQALAKLRDALEDLLA